MSAKASRLPRIFALVGIAITFATDSMWKFLFTHHLVGTHYDSLLILTLVLWPGNILGFVVEDFPGVAWSLIAWLVGVASNGLLYYWLGRGIAALMNRARR